MDVPTAIVKEREHGVSVWLSIDAYVEILNLCNAKFPLETGGVLIGFWNNNDVIITSVVGPGENATHSKNRFVPDQQFHEIQISNNFYASQGRDNYLGDWHTHPDAASYLSEKDRSTLIKIRKNKESNLFTALMLILGTNPLQLNCWACSLNGKKYKIQLQSTIKLYQDLSVFYENK